MKQGEYMRLQERDYLEGLTEKEQEKYREILEEEKRRAGGFGRVYMFREYPKAVRHCLSLFPNNYLDINNLQNEELLKEKNQEFSKIISDNECIERNITKYINKNDGFHIIGSILKCGGYNFGHHDAFLFPEFQLGSSMRPDYLLIGKSSGGYEFIFVELESVYGRITTKDGQLGECFHKGIYQVKDWSRWLQANYDSLFGKFKELKNREECLPEEFIEYDESRMHYVVVAGRRSDFNDLTYRIARESFLKENIKLLHYDNLIDFSNSIVGELSY
ncbi:hypothetical protein HMPREF0369_00320 [Anaerostipes hadrus ATCC 29173 = JCM 17467]|nr:hypothetical protein HMPREF0369_00320 [Anaerostipes hadrus ATCC 29173 = JCM 17467]